MAALDEPGSQLALAFGSSRFGCIAFGLYWALNNFFMPIVFDMSFIQFSPTIMNYVYRIVIDIVFVVLGVWIFENSYST